jgi:hypothetical protein
MNDHRERAVLLLVNYFEAIARAAGMKWDPDYTAEIREAVEAIVTAAVKGADERLNEQFSNLDERLVEVVRRLDKHERQLRGGGL